MKKNKISYRECIQIYNIEEDFLIELQKYGLLETSIEENEHFIDHEHLEKFERYIRWHYDLDINIPGIEALAHILNRVNEMQTRINDLNKEIEMFKLLYGTLAEKDIE